MPRVCSFLRNGTQEKTQEKSPDVSRRYGRVMVPALGRLIGLHPKRNLKSDGDLAEVEDVFRKMSSDEPTKSTCKSDVSNQVFYAGTDEAVVGDSFPAYVDGEQVEYFSRTCQRWIHGIVEVVNKSKNLSDHDSDSGFAYVVTLSRGGIRYNVGLDLLRPLLRPGELVEFSGHVGTRLPAMIVENELPVPSMPGHRVKVEGSGDVFDNVSPLRLKRRYLRNQEVEVYLDNRLGWQIAKIHPTAIPDGCGAAFLDKCLHGNQSVASQENESADFEMGLWSLVPLCLEAGEENELPEWVPSYLVRSL